MALTQPDYPAAVTTDQRLEALERGQAQILAGQAQALAWQCRILELLERGRGARDRAGELLLPAVSADVADRAFSAAELVRHAEVVACSLRAALDAAVVTSNARKLGKLLRAVEGREIDGLQLVRIGVDPRRHRVARAASLKLAHSRTVLCR
jgi:hypothetical protein